MSVDTTLEYLDRHLPRFRGLRRAALWPPPIRRVLVTRWLKGHGLDPGSAAGSGEAAALARGMRLIQRDDRAFCRRVRLEGWRQAADSESVAFELVDERGDLLWPVALRALLLFAGARAAEILPPGGDIGNSAGSCSQRLAVRTQAEPDGSFRVTVAPRG